MDHLHIFYLWFRGVSCFATRWIGAKTGDLLNVWIRSNYAMTRKMTLRVTRKCAMF